MIYDRIENIDRYRNLEEEIRFCLNYLKSQDFKKIEDGKYYLNESKTIYVNIERYETKNKGKLECHKRHIDIQYMLEGQESIGHKVIDKVLLDVIEKNEEYDEKCDVMFINGVKSSSFLNLCEKEFVIFYPSDLHMPQIKSERKEIVRKAVVKIEII